MNEYNPFAAPSAFGDIASENRPMREYGGIRRLPYFGYSFLMNIVLQVVQGVGAANQLPILVLGTIPIALVGGMALAYQRCKNIGMNPWWCLGMFVPILNIFVGLRCLAYPEGYEDHKTLDGPGKVILGVFIGIIVLVVVGVIIAIAAG